MHKTEATDSTPETALEKVNRSLASTMMNLLDTRDHLSGLAHSLGYPMAEDPVAECKKTEDESGKLRDSQQHAQNLADVAAQLHQLINHLATLV